jgi:acetylglutamate kinase
VTRPLVLKFGGELLDDARRLATVVDAVGRISHRLPTVIVHGGGREIDAALKTAGIDKRQIDGLRITDAASLDVVVAVLAGTINSRLVAALNASGVAAVGLTGADAAIGLVSAAPPHRTVDGRTVELGCVGVPLPDAPTRLLEVLVSAQFVPVIACVGSDADGRLFNVNADTMAAAIAARLNARRLVIAGTTPGVLDAAGTTIRSAGPSDIAQLVNVGTATAGMIAKLRACESALARGVDEVVIVDGRNGDALESAAWSESPESATRLTSVNEPRYAETGLQRL